MAQTSVTAKGVYNATPPTETDTQPDFLQVDQRGNLKVTMVTKDGTTVVDQQVQGDVASGAADSGNPVKIGGKYNATLETLVDGQRGDAQMTIRGGLLTALVDASGIKIASVVTPADGMTTGGVGSGPTVVAISAGFNGATYDRLRTPAVFKTVSATALNTTALWTPAAGKKFRLMAYIIEITSNASLAAGAVEVISMLDSASDMAQTHSVFIPTTAVTTGLLDFTTGWITLGNGILSAAANNVLNVNLGTALATGVVRVTCAGTEE